MFIIGGLIYMLASNFNFYNFADLMNTFTRSAVQGTFTARSANSGESGYLSLLLLLPGIFMVVLPVFLNNNNTSRGNILAGTGFLWLAFCETLLMLGIRNHTTELSYPLVWASFVLIQLSVTATAIAGKSRFSLNASIIMFFVSVFLIRLIYGVVLPNLLYLAAFQLIVCFFCFRHQWYFPFVLLMTLSAFYISYYFIKLVLVPGYEGADAAVYMFPSLFIWFLLSASGFGILQPVPHQRKTVNFIRAFLPFVTLIVVMICCLGFYYKAGVNYIYLAYYSAAVILFAIIAILLRRREMLKHGDPFYLLLCTFAAFLLPQFFGTGFFLFLSISLSIALLVSVMFTDLKISFRLSLGLYLITLGLYLYKWIAEIIPVLINQRESGQVYSPGLVTESLLLLALAYFFFTLFPSLLQDYSFSHPQSKKYKLLVRFSFYSILYLCSFLVFDFILVILIPGYRVNFIEWGFFTYAFLYFLLLYRPSKHGSGQKYLFYLSMVLIVFYLVIVQPETIHFRTLFIAGISTALLPFLMHYACLAILVVYLLEANRRMLKIFNKSRFLSNIRTLIAIALLCFILLSEYDNLVLLFLNRFSGKPSYEMLQYNIFIPYSVILLLVSVSLLLWSVIHYTRFLRRVALFMIFVILLKVLFIDITMLSANKGILLLFTLGVVLLVFSTLFSRIRKQSQVAGRSESEPEIRPTGNSAEK